MKNQGITLISLIITIIVIIILASITIITGLSTPESAQFSNYCTQVDNVYVAMLDAYGDLRIEHAISGKTRTNEQIYLEIATGTDHGQYVVMGNNMVVQAINKAVEDGAGCQLIKEKVDSAAATNGYTHPTADGVSIISAGSTKNKLKMNLPKVRENACAWYVTEDGKIFNTTGYIYDGKTYFSASIFFDDEIGAVKDDTESDRAQVIADAMFGIENGVRDDTKANPDLTEVEGMENL